MTDTPYSHLPARKWLGTVPLFDPADGFVVRNPPGDGPGNWAGAPNALYDHRRQRFYLSYRVRRPLTEGRGYETRVAESADGRSFQDIWVGRKDEFDSSSIERSALVITPHGRYRLYVSYVDRAINRWQIDLLEADSPDAFDTRQRRTVLRPEDADSEGVKDPYVLLIGGVYYMYVPYGPRSAVVAGSTEEQLHGTGNVFTTLHIAHPTGLATSADGINFTWRGDVLRPGTGWDRQMARLSCVVYQAPVFTAFYDGRTGVGDVYEDRTGLATGLTPDRFDVVTRDAPVLFSPHGTGALRYLDIVPMDDKLYCYYELCRPDGAHELRGSIVSTD
jgi:hypothetical protein